MSGTWVNLSHPNYLGDYNMTVTKVEGNKVHGRIEKVAFTGGSSASDFVGTLDRDKLTYGSSSTSTELIINGNQLRGTSIENFRLGIEMTRAK